MLAAAGRDIGQELINEIRLKEVPRSFLSWLHNARLRKTHSAQLLRKKSVRKKTITQIQRHVYIFKLLHNYTKIHKHKDKFVIPEKRKRHYMCVSGNAQCTFPTAPFRWTAAVKECKGRCQKKTNLFGTLSQTMGRWVKRWVQSPKLFSENIHSVTFTANIQKCPKTCNA